MLRTLVRRALVLLAVIVAVPLLYWLTLPWPGSLRDTDPVLTSFMRHRMDAAEEAGEEYVLHREWVPLAEMSRELVRAVVVAEDHRFREHRGIDWLALAEETRYDGTVPLSWRSAEDRAALSRALRYAWAQRDSIKGRSTITQQLAKNLYFTPERTLRRKVGEFVVARRLEKSLSKDRILELYLNTVEMGPGLFGMAAASERYFGVAPGRLSRPQAAALAATLPHPLTSNPAHRPARMAWRRDLILRRLGGDPVVIPPVPDPVAIIGVDVSIGATLDTAMTGWPDTVRAEPVGGATAVGADTSGVAPPADTLSVAAVDTIRR